MLRSLSRSFNSVAMSMKMLKTASMKFKIGKVWTLTCFFVWNFKLRCLLSFFPFSVFLFRVFEWIWNPKLPNIWFWCLDIIDFRSFRFIIEPQYFSIMLLYFFLFSGYGQVEIANFLELWLRFALFSIWISMNSNPKF